MKVYRIKKIYPSIKDKFNVGDIIYLLYSRSITCSESCKTYRMTEKNIDTSISSASACTSSNNSTAWDGTTNTYLTELAGTQSRASTTPDCASSACNEAQLADFDVAEISTYAMQYGMTLGMSACPNTTGRQCLFVAWGSTLPTNSSSNANSCVNGNAYRANSTCVMMEVY